MSFQIKPLSKKKDKKGVSVLIGYVMLVAFAVILGVITYTWIKTYVPTDSIECADGVSIFVKGSAYDSNTHNLTVLVKNNGRFNIDGYYIQVSNESDQKIPNIDIAENLASGATSLGNKVLLVLSPNEETLNIFELPDSIGEPLIVGVTPFREQVAGNRERIVTCGDSKVTQNVGSGSVEETAGSGGTCVPQTCQNIGYSCGTWSDGCGGEITCGLCSNVGDVCSGGQCVAEEGCIDTCSRLGYECGTQTICGVQVDCTAEIGGCIGEETCNAQGLCFLECGNGQIDSGEECDVNGGANCQSDCSCPTGYIPDGGLGCTTIGNGVCDSGETCATAPADCEGEQAQCSTGQLCQSGICEWQGGVYGEDEYCVDIGIRDNLGYTGGDCIGNSGQCTSQGNGLVEDDESGAETYCPGIDILCCTPAP